MRKANTRAAFAAVWLLSVAPAWAMFDCFSWPESVLRDLPEGAVAFVGVLEAKNETSRNAWAVQYTISVRVVKEIVGKVPDEAQLRWSMNPIAKPAECEIFSSTVGDRVLVVAVNRGDGLEVAAGEWGVVTTGQPRFRKWRRAVKRSIKRSSSNVAAG